MLKYEKRTFTFVLALPECSQVGHLNRSFLMDSTYTIHTNGSRVLKGKKSPDRFEQTSCAVKWTNHTPDCGRPGKAPPITEKLPESANNFMNN